MSFFKALYITIIILLNFYPVIEIHLLFFTIPILFLFFDKDVFISKNAFNSILLLTAIILIGIISSFFYEKTFYDWFKDLMYFLKPILAIISGFYLAFKVNNLRFIFKIIVLITFLSSLVHLFIIFSQIDFSISSISLIRKVGGISNMFEVVSIAILIASYKYNFLKLFNNRLYKNIIFFIVSVSFLLYFSRTMFVALLIFSLAIFGYLKLTSKGLKYILITTILVGLFYAYLFSTNIDRDKPGIESFLYKLKIAPSEIFIPSKNINVNNHKSLWDHWRAYEAAMAFEEINTSPLSYGFGKGFGALVDLKFKAPLGEEDIRYIPILHNGYVYIILKTGIIGLILYLLFLLALYLNSYKNNTTKETFLIANSIAGISIYYLFTTLIITGAYNMTDTFAFILGVLFFSQYDLNKNVKEISA